jgi:hypothetical protein
VNVAAPRSTKLEISSIESSSTAVAVERGDGRIDLGVRDDGSRAP